MSDFRTCTKHEEAVVVYNAWAKDGQADECPLCFAEVLLKNFETKTAELEKSLHLANEMLVKGVPA